MLIAAAEGRSFQVAVSCKTHNAVNIVLESVAKKWRKLIGFALPSLGRSGMPAISIYKLVNDDGNDVPEGVKKLDAYNAGGAGLERVLDEDFVIIWRHTRWTLQPSKVSQDRRQKRWLGHTSNLISS